MAVNDDRFRNLILQSIIFTYMGISSEVIYTCWYVLLLVRQVCSQILSYTFFPFTYDVMNPILFYIHTYIHTKETHLLTLNVKIAKRQQIALNSNNSVKVLSCLLLCGIYGLHVDTFGVFQFYIIFLMELLRYKKCLYYVKGNFLILDYICIHIV